VGDDVSTTAVPRYIGSIVPGGAANRHIFTDKGGAPIPFFTVTPTTSILLYDYVTDLSGYNTGIAVANTAADATIFSTPTKGQTGSITLYLFQSNSSSVIAYTPVVGDGRGLNASSQLSPGSVFAVDLDTILRNSGNGALVGHFSGYLIALCQFQLAHGFAITVNGAGNGTATNALFLGPIRNGLRADTIGGSLGLDN